MFVSYLPRNDFNITIIIPFFQTYPPPPPPPQQQRDLSQLVSTWICVVGSILLFLFLVVFLYLYFTQPRRSSASEAASSSTNRQEDDEEVGHRDHSGDHHVWRITTLGLHRSAIDSIKVVGFKKGAGIIDGTECSVCLNEFEEDESLRVLPNCNHSFHINCIDTWLLSHKNCPLCRSPILLTQPRHQGTETNHPHQSDSGLSNDLNGEGESSGSRNRNVLARAQSDLANHCGSKSVETVRRSLSIGGSSSLNFYTSFSANFFSSSRRLRNQDQVLPIRMPSVSDSTA
ncbi:unnamed protein product [Microthlaspi erraticum]|uniref:RING-type E3 ubiquitin transferase n=1 Tax=Microthlaspi erraticum TaxID=1685480 RepID=A0A6D2IQ06_9BRAS|nr:unnamed protein product [Microthlaspi erraticum]